MSEERPNIEKELDETTALHIGLMTSTPTEHHPQSPIGKHVLHMQSEPLTYGDVCRSAHSQLWEEAMARELQGLVVNETFSEVIPPNERRPMGSKLIFKWKTTSFEGLVKPQARLVANGYSRTPVVDFQETLSTNRRQRL